jgi:hypothetical protein
MIDQEFPLVYIDENGNQVRARRTPARRYVLEDGREVSKAYMLKHFQFIAMSNYRLPRYEVNPFTGFKVRVKNKRITND